MVKLIIALCNVAHVKKYMYNTHKDTFCTPGKTDSAKVHLHKVSKNTMFAPKVKVKLTLEQATKAQRGRRGIALLFL
jgi:hypothetical protein